jgi:phosphoribosyl 1,2-cyclic phosphate phosphodiesterase
MSLQITILGCGSSGGVPRVGQGWGTCDPIEPKNRRLRCSILVQKKSAEGLTSLLVDTSPDLRQQLLATNTTWLDGVLYTHEHADHTHGIDDLRGLVLAKRHKIDIYADAATLGLLHARFGYCFSSPPGSDYPPILNGHEIRPFQPVEIAGEGGAIEAIPLPVCHGTLAAFGYRFGKVLYTPDLSAIEPSSERHFQGLDLWIIDALREKPHPSHFSLQDALAAIGRFSPKRAVLTNLHNDMDYASLKAKLPLNVEPAWDGLILTG